MKKEFNRMFKNNDNNSKRGKSFVPVFGRKIKSHLPLQLRYTIFNVIETFRIME